MSLGEVYKQKLKPPKKNTPPLIAADASVVILEAICCISFPSYWLRDPLFV